MKVHDFEKLIVWQRSMDLVVEVYKVIEKFPSSELYGLVSQMKRAAISIPSNIAEGSQKSTKKDFAHFLSISMGSGSELRTQIKIAKRLGYCKEADCEKIESTLEEIMKMLNKLVESNRQSSY